MAPERAISSNMRMAPSKWKRVRFTPAVWQRELLGVSSQDHSVYGSWNTKAVTKVRKCLAQYKGEGYRKYDVCINIRTLLCTGVWRHIQSLLLSSRTQKWRRGEGWRKMDQRTERRSKSLLGSCLFSMHSIVLNRAWPAWVTTTELLFFFFCLRSSG